MPNAEHINHLQAEELVEYFEERLPDERNCEIEEHLAECADCTALARRVRVFKREWDGWTAESHGRAFRAHYWESKPVWKPLADVPGEVGAIVKSLAESISLIFGKAGELFEAGLGPPSLEPATQGAPMGVDDTLLAEPQWPRKQGPKEWLIEDKEAGCAIRLVVRGDASGRALLNCTFEGDAETTPPPDRVRISLRSAETDSLLLAGRLSDFQRTPITLRLGSWLVTLETRDIEKQRTWILPLQIAQEEAEQESEGVDADGN